MIETKKSTDAHKTRSKNPYYLGIKRYKKFNSQYNES